ncbi:putative 50S ribosomal protein L28 [Magnetofaba australis IT-1]|uniref:Putative 50S ribosomal protein L28 n=2 Tax=Magnetofaba TaxID=1472292 RepID=A0A1Y2K4E4_9PROT|nr:putative 50S ribosomal protein L28 [Magnetofaba australis IT-1]
MPNIQQKAFFSMALGKHVRVTLSTSEMRTVDRRGGLDEYLLASKPEALSATMLKLRQQIAARAA